MKKLKKLQLIFLLSILFISLTFSNVLANDIMDSITKMDLTEDFINWSNLKEDERTKRLQPRSFEVPNTKVTSKNPFYLARMLGSSIDSDFNLKDVIPNNVNIRNQKNTNSCWAFATISSLETNLALFNYQNKLNASKIYDFSERHMDYSTSNSFLNNATSPFGYNRKVNQGGSWNISSSYLTNGSGAIPEYQMPFENNENLINISEIENKDVSTQVYDTKIFTSSNTYDLKNEIKNHIKNYGSVYASMSTSSLLGTDYYNPTTGALYCIDDKNFPSDHAVSIIGWDDNYSISNFNKNCKPNSKGAWIVRNSYGKYLEYDLYDLKEELFLGNKDFFISIGCTDSTQIPNSVIERLGFIIKNNIATFKMGIDGIQYVSYEDAIIYTDLFGIIKATDTVNYDNIYQYDETFAVTGLALKQSKCLIANIFETKTNDTEYLTEVSLIAPETYTCKVFVNPKGENMQKQDLIPVKLKSGDSETFDAGYHTLEFAEPIAIESSKFVVAIEIQGTRNNSLSVLTEQVIPSISWFQNINTEINKCFLTTDEYLESSFWLDLGNFATYNPSFSNGDSTIKAFTVSELHGDVLSNIEVTSPPDKVLYWEGENFDPKGMVVRANYNNGVSTELKSSSYSITNGNNLKAGQTSVTITFENKSVKQAINVDKNSVVKLNIQTPPKKLDYKEGEDFDKAGMVIEAVRKDGSKETVTNYTISNQYNLKTNQTFVTICFEDVTVNQEITVIPNPLVEIKVTQKPNKTNYIVGQDFDKTGMIVTGIYLDESTFEIKEYTIEDGKNLRKDQSFVTINFEGKTTTQEIFVEEKNVDKILIDKKPTKLTYIQNKEELELSGGTLKIVYNDGSTEIIEMTSSKVIASGFSNKNLGKIAITLSYENKITTFDVEIVEEVSNSDLSNLSCKVNSVKAYYFTNNSEKDYTLIDLNIKGIVLNSNNEECEYYYYLSSSANEKNITDWNKIEENIDKNSNLHFTIDSRQIENYDEISKEQVLYLYIKEVAKKGGAQKIAISNAITLETDVTVETYLDNAKQEHSNSSNTNNDDTSNDNKDNDNNTGNNNSNPKDNTLISGILPATGTKNIIIAFSIFTLIITGIFCYIKYNKFKDIV